MKRNAFTLIELLISITILSIIMLFLYKSYADLNKTNKVYEKEVAKLEHISRIKQVLYLDLLLANKETLKVLHQDGKFDFVSFASEHSLHRLIKPYVAYIVKEKILYRLESNKVIGSTEISREQPFIIDKIGSVKKFKLYISAGENKEQIGVLEADFKDTAPIALKIKALN